MPRPTKLQQQTARRFDELLARHFERTRGIDANAEQRERYRAQAERDVRAEGRAHLDAAEIEVERLFRCGDAIDAYRLHVQALAECHGLAIEWRRTMPQGVAGYAEGTAGRAVCQPIEDEASAAVVYHEIGHLLCGRCPRKEPHRPNPTVRDWHHCVACETEATAMAMRIAPRWSRTMHERLADGLRQYRRKTPAPASAIAALDHTRSSLAWYEDRQRRRRWQMRLDLIHKWQGEKR